MKKERFILKTILGDTVDITVTTTGSTYHEVTSTNIDTGEPTRKVFLNRERAYAFADKLDQTLNNA